MNTIKPFQVINGEELMDMDYKPVSVLVVLVKLFCYTLFEKIFNQI